MFCLESQKKHGHNALDSSLQSLIVSSMPVRICSCTAAKCPIAQPLHGRCVGAVMPPHCLPGERSCNIWELHTSGILGGKLLERVGEGHFYLPLGNNIPCVSLISDLSYKFFFPSCWKHSSYKRGWSLFSSCGNPLTHVRDKFAPQDSKESSQSSLACKESLLLLKSILRQNVFSPTQLANSTGWYWVGSRTISLQLLPFTLLFSNHHPTWLYGSCLSSAAQPLPDMEWKKTISWFFPPCFSQPWSLTWTTPDSSLPPDCKTAKAFSAGRVCGNITSILMASYWQCLASSLLACKHLLRSVKPLWHLCAVCKRKGVAKDLHWRLSLHFIRSYLKNAIWRVKLDLVRQFRRDQWSFISYSPNLRARIPLPKLLSSRFSSEMWGLCSLPPSCLLKILYLTSQNFSLWGCIIWLLHSDLFDSSGSTGKLDSYTKAQSSSIK